MNTLDQLKACYNANYIHLTTLLNDHFTHIKNTRYFLTQVRTGRIKIKLSRLGDSRKAPHIVYLKDLADYLDSK